MCLMYAELKYIVFCLELCVHIQSLFPFQKTISIGEPMLYMFVIATMLILIGELGDKSQLLALLLATRYKIWQVVVGIFLATFTVHFFTTGIGMLVGGALPNWLMPWITGILFVGFGIWTLRGDKVDEAEADKGFHRFGPIAATFVAFFIAELGDKTQLMTLAIAADPGGTIAQFPAVANVLQYFGLAATHVSKAQEFWAVTLGSTVGMVLADMIAILVGRMLGKSLPEKLITRVSGCLFIALGVFSIISVFV